MIPERPIQLLRPSHIYSHPKPSHRSPFRLNSSFPPALVSPITLFCSHPFLQPAVALVTLIRFSYPSHLQSLTYFLSLAALPAVTSYVAKISPAVTPTAVPSASTPVPSQSPLFPLSSPLSPLQSRLSPLQSPLSHLQSPWLFCSHPGSSAVTPVRSVVTPVPSAFTLIPSTVTPFPLQSPLSPL